MTEKEWEEFMQREEFIMDQLESVGRMLDLDIDTKDFISKRNLENLSKILKDSGE